MKTIKESFFHPLHVSLAELLKQATIAFLFCFSASLTCYAQNPDDGDMLYIYTKNSTEATLSQLDDLNKITFSNNGVCIWNTGWPTEYPYSKVSVITFRKKNNDAPTGIETIPEENGLISTVTTNIVE